MAMAMDIPLLPVHDSFAVPRRFGEVTEHGMKMAWKVVMEESAANDNLLEKAAVERRLCIYLRREMMEGEPLRL